MNAFVVDASVVIKWFVPEIHSQAARSLLMQDCHCFAPDLLFAETANAIWKKVRRGELSSSDGNGVVRALLNVAVETISSQALAADAFSLAVSTGLTVYDAMYLALAVRLNTKMLTADERMANSLKGIPATASRIQLIQTLSAV